MILRKDITSKLLQSNRFSTGSPISYRGCGTSSGTLPALLEGSFPVDHFNLSALKHLLHYGKQTGDAGLLDWFSMFCFERNNKQAKHWVKRSAHPLTSLTNHVEVDILVRLEVFVNLTVRSPWEPHLTVLVKGYVLADRERNDIALLGATSFRQCKSFKVCEVLGFISGQGSGATTGVVLSSPPSTVGYHDTVSCRCKFTIVDNTKFDEIRSH